MLNWIAQKPIEGVSMVYTFDKANANVASRRTTQYREMMVNRAIYHDGWIACTTPPAGPWLMGLGKLPEVVNGYKWELYNIADDYSEYHDLAAQQPDRLRTMQELFIVEAAKYNVFPLDNDVLGRLLVPRPSYTAGRTSFTYSGALSGIPNSSAPNILAKSYTITAEGKGGTGVLSIDGKDAATKTIPHTIPFILTIDGTLDIGSDTRSPVDDNDYNAVPLHRQDRQGHVHAAARTINWRRSES